MLETGYVLDPDPYLLPSYGIGPFSTTDVSLNRRAPASRRIDEVFADRFGDGYYEYTLNGREAIGLALGELGLRSTDVVSILTTTGNAYISGCVTQEIEKVCRWNRVIDGNTRAILVNHEFGFPYEELRALRNHGVPIIEDCAHAFTAQNSERSVGQVGDYLIFSFPKFFPIQIGGLLVRRERRSAAGSVGRDVIDYIRNVLSRDSASIDAWSTARRNNYTALADRFSSRGCTARFPMLAGAVPGSFMCTLTDGTDGPRLKRGFWERGIQASLFYPESAVFMPVHHRLTVDDLDYFVSCFDHLTKRMSLLQ